MLLSLIVPCYNEQEALPLFYSETMKVLSQMDCDYELLLINDGSTDGGAGRDICLSYGDKIYYFEKENGGCASALNFGIRQARGEFISWLSHDDLYDANKIETQVSYYDTCSLNPENTLVSNSGRLINENGESIYRPNNAKTGLLNAVQMFRQLLFCEGFNGCGLLIPKNWFDKGLYFREDMRFVLDWNLWQKFAINGAQIYVNKEILVSNRLHSQQVTVKQADRHRPELAQSCQEIFELLKCHENPEFIRLLYYYCEATDQTIARDIATDMKQRNISVRKLRKLKYVCKKKSTRLAKRAYHALRKIHYKR